MNNDQQQRWVTRARDIASVILLAEKELYALNREYVAQDLGNVLTDPPPGHEVDKADCVNLISGVFPAITSLVDTHATTLHELKNNREHL